MSCLCFIALFKKCKLEWQFFFVEEIQFQRYKFILACITTFSKRHFLFYNLQYFLYKAKVFIHVYSIYILALCRLKMKTSSLYHKYKWFLISSIRPHNRVICPSNSPVQIRSFFLPIMQYKYFWGFFRCDVFILSQWHTKQICSNKTDYRSKTKF